MTARSSIIIVLVTILYYAVARPQEHFDIASLEIRNRYPILNINSGPDKNIDARSDTSLVTRQFYSSQPARNLCGNDDKIILEGTPWLVANSMYGASSMQGTSCTNYDHIESSGDPSRVVWGSETHVRNVPDTYVHLLVILHASCCADTTTAVRTLVKDMQTSL